ncbi:MAG: molybdenum cofactor biosynthesis protein MoaE [Acidiferrobacterales bacterium]|nr:molybdenum cofactor biosynthesis protein MoaE [Acidiferrobacterales bacterium]
MQIRVLGQAFHPWQELAAYEDTHPELQGLTGGLATFVGSMRDNNAGVEVEAMELQHYSGMTEKFLERVAEEAMKEWSLIDALIIHRYGPLQPGDPIVLVAAWAAHRDEAFRACRYMIDELKTRAPFWKNETTPEGKRWVEQE